MSFNPKQITPQTILRKFCFLHIPIILCLYILTDDISTNPSSNTNNNAHHHHLAVFTALQRHPPSARIFRCIFEFILVGFCASLSMYVWESVLLNDNDNDKKRNGDEDILHQLLFQVPYTLVDEQKRNVHTNTSRDGDDDDDDVEEKYELVTLIGRCDDFNSHNNDGLLGEGSNIDNLKQENYKTQQPEEQTDPIQEEANTNDNNIPSISSFSSTASSTTPISLQLCNTTCNILLYTLITLFLFTFSSSAGGKYIDQTNYNHNNNTKNLQLFFSNLSKITAPIFPLSLFCVLFTSYLFIPWNTKKRYMWTLVGYTIGAPMYRVQFRDGFLGDVFTSIVRPMQDVAFTLFYVMSGLKGYWSYKSMNPVAISSSSSSSSSSSVDLLDHDAVLTPVETSWLLHTVIIPACIISPLWWRFCQTLRQAYDGRQRWPYLGNALKYFLAAQFGMFGIFHPSSRQSNGNENNTLWMIGFICVTLYQVWWDVFMDWKLFIYTYNPHTQSYKWTLRKQRLYSSTVFYYLIFGLNFILRFGWSLTFIPTKYLSPTSGMLTNTFSHLITTSIEPILASAEIIRRTMWGFLRVELEVLNVSGAFHHTNDSNSNRNNEGNKLMNNSDLIPMEISSSFRRSKRTFMWNTNLSSYSEIQVLLELCSYALVFASLGMIAAAHRQVL